MFSSGLPANVDDKRDPSNLRIIFDLLRFRSFKKSALNEPEICCWIVYTTKVFHWTEAIGRETWLLK